jgi:NAD(P)-dependent dehydrogenase (short-subunit alcohol dehydrogenase family)
MFNDSSNPREWCQRELEDDMGRLDGKVALVTGSNRGIGRAIAKMFAMEGAAVVVTGRNEERGRDVADEIISAGGRAVSLPADIGDEASVQRLVADTVDALGGLHVLVNNAAPLEDVARASGPIGNSNTDQIEHILRIGLLGPYFAIKYAVPHMQAAGGGSIVNISTTATITGLAGQPGYSMAKGGLNALTVNVAYDYGPSIRCNAILAGMVNSGTGTRTAAFNADPAWKEAQRAMHVTRAGEVDDIASLATFLAADAGYITGALIVADGGATIKTNMPIMAGRWYPDHAMPAG